jgi:hypothetical protein
VIFTKKVVMFTYFLLENIVEFIAKYVSKYQTHINSLKSRSYIIAEYARKSPSHVDGNTLSIVNL